MPISIVDSKLMLSMDPPKEPVSKLYSDSTLPEHMPESSGSNYGTQVDIKPVSLRLLLEPVTGVKRP